MLVTKHKYGKALHGEAPHHTERISLAQHEDVSSAEENGEELEPHHQIQDAMRSAETVVGLAKPMGENSILRDSVQDTVGAHDGGIDGPGQH